MKNKASVHFTASYLLQPTNSVTLNIIGAGGNGSQMLMAVARMHYALKALGHTGFDVQVFDPDNVSEANLGRQLFATSELGLPKAVVLINRVNRFFGTNWKAITSQFDRESVKMEPAKFAANITISCVDTVQARMEIAKILPVLNSDVTHQPLYWMDLGNAHSSGQTILSTIGAIKQPTSKKYKCVAVLPDISTLMETAEILDDEMPSCSLAEALSKQDLFINSSLVYMSASLLWQLFREGMTTTRGFYLNLKTYCAQPLPIK